MAAGSELREASVCMAVDDLQRYSLLSPWYGLFYCSSSLIVHIKDSQSIATRPIT